jgi:hypothetical protein
LILPACNYNRELQREKARFVGCWQCGNFEGAEEAVGEAGEEVGV